MKILDTVMVVVSNKTNALSRFKGTAKTQELCCGMNYPPSGRWKYGHAKAFLQICKLHVLLQPV